MSSKTEKFETYRGFVMSFEASNKKGYSRKNTWVTMGYPGFEVQGDLQILKELYYTLGNKAGFTDEVGCPI